MRRDLKVQARSAFIGADRSEVSFESVVLSLILIRFLRSMFEANG